MDTMKHARSHFLVIFLWIWITIQSVAAFVPLFVQPTITARSRARSTRNQKHAEAVSSGEDGWIDLSGDGGVQKKILAQGEGEEPYPKGTLVSYSYKGTLAAVEWSVDEVITCWLSEQQGLDHLADGFREHNVDESKLTDLETGFTEAFVQDELGVTAKIAAKKLVMAAKRLKNSRADFPPGSEFDSSDEYQFTVGSGKLIRGMEIGIASMKPGENCEILVRSDYAYGGEGYRKRNGDVMVPPFATLNFLVKT